MGLVRSTYLVAGLLPTALTQAGPISVSNTRIDNGYPERIVFEIEVSSSAPISRVELHVSLRGDTSTSVIGADQLPGAVTTARAEWKTRRGGIPV